MSHTELPISHKRLRLDSGMDFPEPASIYEHALYTADVPYSIERQKYEHGAVTRPHYAHTLEVIVSFGLKGTYRIGENKLPMEKNSVFVIPPKVLHSGIILASDSGYLINLKFDFDRLRQTVNIESLLAQKGLTIKSFSDCHPNYGDIVAAVQELVRADDDPFERCAALLGFFIVCVRGIGGCAERQSDSGGALSQLIDWTEANYKSDIGIDDAAQVLHLSRSYFCRFFHAKTGMTYLTYLNRLRVEQAQLMLLSGMSASACCIECGFGDLSYFIQLFKRVTGLTTREYVKKFAASRRE